MGLRQRLALATVATLGAVAAIVVVFDTGNDSPNPDTAAAKPQKRATTNAERAARYEAYQRGELRNSEELRDAIQQAALEEALATDPCEAPLAVYRLGLGGIWTIGHADGKPPRIQAERLLGVRMARRMINRAEAIHDRRGIDTMPLNDVLPGCG